MNPREAGIALMLPGLLALAVLAAPASPGPGPLDLCVAAVALHAALLAPATARGGPAFAFLPLLLALPALFALSYGQPFWGALLVAALACCAGWAARVAQSALYLPTMMLLFFAPYALHYLALEFGKQADAGFWLALSPLAGAGGAPSLGCILLMLAWPVWALARRAF